MSALLGLVAALDVEGVDDVIEEYPDILLRKMLPSQAVRQELRKLNLPISVRIYVLLYFSDLLVIYHSQTMSVFPFKKLRLALSQFQIPFDRGAAGLAVQNFLLGGRREGRTQDI